MATSSGLTSFGIIRRRMADLYLNFATRIKEGGAFGTQTTVDQPDLFPGDPLVQIASASSASAHELWEAVELFYSQLDPETASGIYLERLHGARIGTARAIGQSDDEYRQIILQTMRQRPSRSDPASIAAARDDVDCARLVLSTIGAAVEGIPAPGAMLVVKGCSVDYQALAADLYNGVELGLHTWYGSVTAGHRPIAGGCVVYNFQPALTMFAAVRVTGYSVDACSTADHASVKAAILSKLRTAFVGCELGSGFNSALALGAIGQIDGFVVTGLTLARRPRQLIADGCPLDGLTTVMDCGVETPWASSITCGVGAGEVWCDAYQACLALLPWETLAFDEQFITVVDDLTQGGCL